MEDKKKNQGEERREGSGSPIHSQVRKIKQEYEKIKDPYPPEPEVRPALRDITRQLSPSPLGRAGRPISIGDQ